MIFLVITFLHLPPVRLPMANDLACIMKGQEIASDYLARNHLADQLEKWSCEIRAPGRDA